MNDSFNEITDVKFYNNAIKNYNDKFEKIDKNKNYIELKDEDKIDDKTMPTIFKTFKEFKKCVLDKFGTLNDKELYVSYTINDWRSTKSIVQQITDIKRIAGPGIIFYSNNNRYEGELGNGKEHGKGTFFFTNGTTKEGTWSNGDETDCIIKCRDGVDIKVKKCSVDQNTIYYLNGIEDVEYFCEQDGDFIDDELQLSWVQKNGNKVEYTAYWKNNEVDTTKGSTLVVKNNQGEELHRYKNYYPILNRKDISNDIPNIFFSIPFTKKDILWRSRESWCCLCQDNLANETEMNIS